MALTLVIGCLGLIALTVIFGPRLFGTSRSLEAYICARCGMVKQVDKEKLGLIPYRSETKDYETGVARVLGQHPDCAHIWLLYAYRPNLSRPFSPNTPGGDRANGTLASAPTYDAKFLDELAGMANKQEAWNSFATALASNAAFEKAYVDWRYVGHNTNASVFTWATSNGYLSLPTHGAPASSR